MSGLLLHEIAPVYDARSRVLLLGSFPSPLSRKEGFYYGNPRNRFWAVIAGVLGRPEPQGVAEKRALLLCHGIALWDVLRACEIKGASDASIRSAQPNDLAPIFAAADIRAVFTTGQAAQKLYNKYLRDIWQRPAAALPSTSPANCAWDTGRLIQAYRQITPFLPQGAGASQDDI